MTFTAPGRDDQGLLRIDSPIWRGDHTVALKSDGTVVAWGNHCCSQTSVPAGLSGVTAIAAGGYHTVALGVAKTDQTISFRALANKTYGDADFTVSATDSSGLPVAFSAGAADQCTVAGTTVHLTAAGSCTITASQPGDSTYNAAPPVSETFSIAQAQATITLDAASLSQTYDGTPKAATAMTNPASLSGVTLSYSQNGTPITSPTNAGSYTVVAALTNPNYHAANATGTLVIAQATPVITWPSPAPITYGTALGATQLNATATFNGAAVPGSFVYTPAAGTILTPGAAQPLAVSFTPTDSVNYSSTGKTVPITVIYRFDGFLQPIDDTTHPETCGSPCPMSVFKAGSTVSVKFQLKKVDGTVVQAATAPTFSAVQSGSTTAAVDESTVTATADTTNTFR